MQESYIDESQLSRHFSILLKWSVVDSKLFKITITPLTISRPALHLHNLKAIFKEYSDENGKIRMTAAWYQGWLEWFGLKQNQNDYGYIIDTYTAVSAIMSVLLYNPLQCRGLGSHPSEAHVKIQMWSRILSDSFVLNQIRFEPVWELNHLFPGHAKEGSLRTDFAAVIINSRQSQYPFFIVEFEQQGFEVHKDFAVIVCEAVFELNRILSRAQGLSLTEITQIKIYVGFINDASITLGVIRPIFNKEKMAVLFTYDWDIAFYNIQTGYH